MGVIPDGHYEEFTVVCSKYSSTYSQEHNGVEDDTRSKDHPILALTMSVVDNGVINYNLLPKDKILFLILSTQANISIQDT